MGRKIPGKKHRTVVYPEIQRARRLELLKNKINNPPPQPDEQEVPRSLLAIAKLKKKAQVNTSITKKKNETNKNKKKGKCQPLAVEQFLDKSERKRPDKFIPNLVQRPQESQESFLNRVNKMTKNIIKEAQFEVKYGITIKKDLKTGKILKIEKDLQSKSGKKRRESKKKSLAEKRKEKKIKKALSEKDCKDFSSLRDNVEFGEVVHRPPLKLPTLKVLDKTNLQQDKKGRYDNLLLQNLTNNKEKKSASSANRLQLEKLEKQQKFIIEAYRERKKELRLLNKKHDPSTITL